MTSVDEGAAVPSGGFQRVDGSALVFLASACGATSAAVAMVLTARARILFEQPFLGALLWAVAAALGCAAGWAAGRRYGFRRRPLSPRLAVVIVAAAFATVWGAQSAAEWAFPSPWARYVRELGGQGACLSGTPYGEGTASVVTMPKRGEDRMEVWPGGAGGAARATGVLRLDNAVSGGLRRLAPADEASETILRSFGCR
ncbi:hypothetical protein [Streptomyces vinaceus]|uniref:hypothetical protein n=1 Tax=Streptomyces vinaceus TaxID=1960 RepID=UPI00381CAC4B